MINLAVVSIKDIIKLLKKIKNNEQETKVLNCEN